MVIFVLFLSVKKNADVHEATQLQIKMEIWI